MIKIVNLLDKILATFLIILMSCMVLDVTWQVFTRFILQHPSSFTEELANYLLIWIGLLGASYAFRTKAHLGVDILTARFRRINGYLIEILINGFVFLFALFVMVIGGFKLVLLTYNLNQISAAMRIKICYIYSVIPVSGLLIMFYSVVFIISAGEIQKANTQKIHRQE